MIYMKNRHERCSFRADFYTWGLYVLFPFWVGMLGLMLFFAKFFWCYAVDLFEFFVEIGYGVKADIVADGRDCVVCILQLESGLLQADLVQVFRHRIAGVLPELPAQVGLAEMEGLQYFVKAGLQKFIHMKTAQQLPEPYGIICVIVADFFLHKKV